ncbi:MAG: HEAT repeat domain-containing protein [Deltaproteobacteria bacterium]|jgi:HEAT repeat protein
MNQADLPPGFTPKTKKGGVRNTFQSTVLGTAVFVAEMQRKVPLRTKIAVLTLLLVVAAGAGLAVHRSQTRASQEEQLASALASPPADALPALRTLIEDSLLDDASRIRAITRVGELRDDGAVPALIGCLSRSDDIRLAAADALARVGSPGAVSAQERLLELTRDAQVVDPLPYAWALATIGHSDSAEIVVEAIPSGQAQTLPSYDPALLARSLGAARLVPRLGHADPRIRQFAASSLGPLCDASAVAPLTAAAADPERDVRLAALVSLARCSTPEALAALDQNLDRDRTLWPALQTAFLADVGAPAMTVLIAHVEDGQTRGAMLTALAAIADPRGGDALVTELERRPDPDGRIRLQIAAALAEISDPRLAAVLEPVISDGEGEWPAAAIAMLGRTGVAGDVEERLVELAGPGSTRTAALAALAEVRACSEPALAVYRRSVRSEPAALTALARCSDPVALETARTRLAQALPERGQTRAGEGAMWRASLEAIAIARARDLSGRLLDLATDANADPTLRSDVGAVLGVVGDDATLDTAADRVLDARTPAGVRQALVRALRRRTPSAALSRLMGYVRGGEDDERSRVAAVIVGEQASPEIRAELVALLGDERAKRHAAVALVLGGDAASSDALARTLAADGALATEINTRLTELEHEVVPELVIPRVLQGARLRELALGLFLDRYTQALRASEGGPASPSARILRRQLEVQLSSEDAETRRGAAEAIAGLGARGVLLALRQSERAGAEEADRVLSPHGRR